MEMSVFDDEMALAPVAASGVTSVQKNPARGYLASLRSSGSRIVQLKALGSVVRLLDHSAAKDDEEAVRDFNWLALDNESLQALVTRLGELHAPATANRKWYAVRAVLKQAWLNGSLNQDQFARLVTIKPVVGSREKKGRALETGEILALFRDCQQEFTDERRGNLARRDAAMLALLYGAGLRRAEAAGLHLEAWRRSDETILVLGKRNKERRIPLPAGSVRALEAWLVVRGSQPGPLLLPIRSGNGGGAIIYQEACITPQTIFDVLRARALRCNVRDVTPHDFRRTFIGDLLMTSDLATVQALAGHSDPKQTAAYDRRKDEVRREAVNRLHVPF